MHRSVFRLFCFRCDIHSRNNVFSRCDVCSRNRIHSWDNVRSGNIICSRFDVCSRCDAIAPYGIGFNILYHNDCVNMVWHNHIRINRNIFTNIIFDFLFCDFLYFRKNHFFILYFSEKMFSPLRITYNPNASIIVLIQKRWFWRSSMVRY